MYEGNLISNLIETSQKHYAQIGEQMDAYAQFAMFLPCWHPAKPTLEESALWGEEPCDQHVPE
jgi:hypothetical protein